MSETQGTRLPTYQEKRHQQTQEGIARRVERERQLADRLANWLGADLIARDDFRDQFTVVTTLSRVHAALSYCKDLLGFSMLVDVTAADLLQLEGDHPERFVVVWNLLNLDQEARLRVKAYVAEDEPTAPTASDLWASADWAEREVYDMFGIEFSDHPNLIRILMPLEYSGYPLRKDYPLRGRGERDNFPVIRRAQS